MPSPSTSGQNQAAGLAARIEHTLLRADATLADVDRLCAEAVANGFVGVCVAGAHVARAAQELEGSGRLVVTVVGFPLGSSSTAVKAFETAEAVRDGADEVDMVIAIGALKAGADEAVRRDIRAVVEAAEGRPVKVILETACLEDGEKTRGARLAAEAGAAYVKTSTGFAAGGATVDDVALLRAAVGPDVGVKASGGVRDARAALAIVAAGANRIGASAGVAIVREAKEIGSREPAAEAAEE